MGGIGYLTGRPDAEVRAELIRFIIEADAKIVLASHNMGYTRVWIYNMIWKHELWPLVNRLRLERIERKRQESKHGISHGRAFSDEG